MELKNIQEVYLAGIGGIGMSGLARYFHHKGCRVSGYDRTATPLTDQLMKEGIGISFEDDAAQLPVSFSVPDATNLVIYTPALPKDSAILCRLRETGFVLHKRSEVLGMISRRMFTIAVAGTHGKTTTSCLIAHIFKQSGKDCSAFLGGIATNYDTNVLFGASNILVVEADEYDRSFLTLHPDIAIVTSMDADHLDIYGDKNRLIRSFRLFASQLKPQGMLIKKAALELKGGISYSATGPAAAVAENIRIYDGCFVFDFRNADTEIKEIKNGLPGLYNAENAVAAIQAALIAGIDPQKIKAAVQSFKGVKRRFEYIVKNDAHIYIDDYAHHPEELRACITAVKSLYPTRELTVIFQPHLYSRTRDFANEFGEALSMADDLLLLEIYPARELPIPGISSAFLMDKIKLLNKRRCDKKEALTIIRQQRPELLLTVGAGDIDTLVEPLKNALNHA